MFNCLVIILAKVINFLVKLCGKNGGNVVGKVARKLSPNIIKYFKIDCPVIAVTATNGKTTTNNCIKEVIKANGKNVVCNDKGNNMETGIISTFIANSSITGKIKADYITLEVDESYVPIVFKKIKLDTLVVVNFFRDQLDRNGEVESLILKIKDFLSTFEGNVILNRDDPNVCKLGLANPNNKNVKYFSVEKYKYATRNEREAGEGKFCPNDKTKLKYSYYQYSHVGKYKCEKCGFGTEKIDTLLEKIDVNKGTFELDGKTYKTLAHNIYTMYNYAAVAAVAKIYDLKIKEALAKFKLDNGRCETMKIKNVTTLVNLAKNPTGANVSLRMLNEDEDDKELLFVLNDKIADGKDVSWIWDINFDVNNCKRIITAGTRGYDMAIRIKNSGYDKEKIEAYLDIDEAVESLYSNKKKKYVIANYTALQPTRASLKKYNNK